MISKRDIALLKVAIKVARRSTAHHKHGCIVVSGGRIISMAVNSYATGWHAEAKAIHGLECRGARLYVARLRKQQLAGLSAPCSQCLLAIRKAGIRRVVYTTNDPISFGAAYLVFNSDGALQVEER